MKYRLASSVLAEPLVNDWGSWWMNLAPIPASLHLARTQLVAMRSYLGDPALHEQLSLTMPGTNCIGIPAAEAPKVAELLKRSEGALSDMVAAAEGIDALRELLRLEAKGQPMEALYARVPACLKGLIELTYDYENRPSFRLMEGLAYRSNLYKPSLQSMRLSHVLADGRRPSLFNTPRIALPGEWSWQLPFSDARLDSLFALDVEAQPLEKIQDSLGLDSKELELLRPFLSEQPLTPRVPWRQTTVRVQYIGHASALVECGGTSVLIDPLISPIPAAPGNSPRYGFQDLPPQIDVALVTHAHADHFAIETLLRLRHRIGCLVVPKSAGSVLGDVSLALLARMIGFKNVVEIGHMDSVALEGGEVIGVPFLGEHGDLPHAKAAYAVRMGGETILFVADSQCLEPAVYARVREALGPISTVFMNIETEGSPLTFTIDALFPRERDRKLERTRRCRGSNCAEAMSLLRAVGASRVFNYAMGLEPWLDYLLGPADANAPRIAESDSLLKLATDAGLRARRLQGSQEILLSH